MFSFLRDWSIKWKLTFVVLATSSVVCLITCTIFIVNDLWSFQDRIVKDFIQLAETVATDCKAPLALDDPKSLKAALSPLVSNTHITSACVYGPGGQILASYFRENHMSPDPPRKPGAPGTSFHRGYLVLFHDVTAIGKKLGTVYLQRDIVELKSRTQWYLVTISIVLAGASLVAFLLAVQIHKHISRPILSLAGMARAVTQEKDFSLRAEKVGGDEIGTLVEAFNGMLEEIQNRNQELQRHGRFLEMEVTKRTAALQEANENLHMEIVEHRKTERELENARNIADAANRAKSEFLATMSHELRTPMNAIIGMASLLLDGRLDKEDRDFAKTIRGSADSLLVILNDILDFSRIEAGKLLLEPEPFDLRRCIDSAMELVAPKAHEKALEVVCIVEAHIPGLIVSDPTRVRQILINLLSNAIKFTHHGKVVVTVTARAESASDGHSGDPSSLPSGPRDLEPGGRTRQVIQFQVEDTGIGIPRERMGRLFRAFMQGDASITRQYGGTGLGLAISKKLCELMGGQIWVESIVGKGTSFYFTIEAEIPDAPQPVYLSSVQPVLKGKRALIVDSNEAVLRSIMQQMDSWHMESVGAETDKEALRHLHSGASFDLAFIDVETPTSQGPALVEEIRNHPRWNTLPLVMMSSHRGFNWTGFHQHHFADRLTKPVRMSELYNTLVHLLTEGSAPRAHGDRADAEKSEFDPGMGRRQPLSILVAEDNTINLQLAIFMLQRLGYRGDVAGNGKEALEALARRTYDVVLLDVQMPVMDGLEAARSIRQTVPSPLQPYIIAMTANAMQGDREQCLAAGMDDYVSKPIVVSELMKALARGHSRTGRQAELPTPTIPMQAALPGEEPDAPLDPMAMSRLRRTLGSRAQVVLPKLVQDFRKDAVVLQSEAREAAEQGRTDELHRAAHTLKSSCAAFGANSLAELCRKLEREAKAGNVAQAPRLLELMAQEWERIESALASEEFGQEESLSQSTQGVALAKNTS